MKSSKIFATAAGLALASAGFCQPFFSQRDSAWAADRLLPSSWTIGNSGCLMTSIAMGLKARNHNLTPKTFNNYLSNNGGYSIGGYLVWSAVSNYDGAGGIQYLGTGNATPAQMKGQIDQGKIVLANSKRFASGHWVYVDHYVNDGSRITDYRYLDPWDTSAAWRSAGDGWVINSASTRLVAAPRLTGDGPAEEIIDDSNYTGNPNVEGYTDWWSRYGWATKSGYGLNGNMRATKNNTPSQGVDAVACWTFQMNSNGLWRFYPYIPRNYATTRSARTRSIATARTREPGL